MSSPAIARSAPIAAPLAPVPRTAILLPIPCPQVRLTPHKGVEAAIMVTPCASAAPDPEVCGDDGALNITIIDQDADARSILAVG